jgi:hypothetical protein
MKNLAPAPIIGSKIDDFNDDFNLSISDKKRGVEESREAAAKKFRKHFDRLERCKGRDEMVSALGHITRHLSISSSQDIGIFAELG